MDFTGQPCQRQKAMFYVVVEELIPEASSGKHSNLSTIGFAIGFVLMMVLDVVMG
jgi:ZIP family zinc transporter